jgi:hypothetical protein
MTRVRALATLAVLVGCTSDPASPSGPDVESHITSFEVPAKVAPKLDLVVAIDNTMAIEAYDAQLSALADALAKGPPRDIRFLLTTTNTYEDLRSTPHFFAPPTQNFTGPIEAAIPFAFMFPHTNAAASGPLSFMKPQVGQSDFVRDDAMLAVLIVSTVDDASASDDYVAWLKSLKPNDPTMILVAAIAPSDAPKLDALLAAFPNRNTRIAITDRDWTPAAEFLGGFYKSTLGALCLPEPLDLLTDVDGDQYDCSVSAFDEGDVEHVLPACGSADEPCWSIRRDPQTCFEPEPSTLVLGGGFAWQYHPKIHGQCVTR